MNTTGLQIKKIRTLRGLSQKDLALKVGFKAASGISRIENGERKIKSNKLKEIAGVLDVPPSLLLEEHCDSLLFDTEFADFIEFIPYLQKANEATLQAVRKLLDMPEKK